MMKNYCLFLLILLGLSNYTYAQYPGCPGVVMDPSGVGITVNGDGTLTACEQGTEITLTANYLKTGSSIEYAVSEIPYDPPFPFTGSPNAITLSSDDYWSDVIDLGFDICFFDTVRNKALINDNGALTFSVLGYGGIYVPGAWTNYSWTTTVPSPPSTTDGPLYRSAIFGAMQDLLPSGSFEGYSVNYEVVGEYPCRTLVFNVYNAGHFSCTTNVGANTMQIVIYEGTNIIDVYVK